MILSSADGDPPANGERRAGAAAGGAGTAREYLGNRLSDQYRDHYHLIASVFNGVVLAGAAVSLLAILATDEPTGPRVAALSLWLGSFASLICTYNGPIVNSILITRAPNFVDVITPFLLGVMGFAQFAVLVPIRAAGNAPAAPGGAQVDHLTWWFLAAAALWAVVLPNLSNTLAQVGATVEESPEDVAPLVRWCEGIVRKAVQGTVAIVVSLLVAFLLLRVRPTEQLWKWQAALGLGYFGGMGALVMIQEQARRAMVASVSDEVTVG